MAADTKNVIPLPIFRMAIAPFSFPLSSQVSICARRIKSELDTIGITQNAPF